MDILKKKDIVSDIDKKVFENLYYENKTLFYMLFTVLEMEELKIIDYKTGQHYISQILEHREDIELLNNKISK